MVTYSRENIETGEILWEKEYMTYAEALAAGYKVVRVAFARGYVSRKTNMDEQPVMESKRCGLYVDAPCWKSTTYHYRYYLDK